MAGADRGTVVVVVIRTWRVDRIAVQVLVSMRILLWNGVYSVISGYLKWVTKVGTRNDLTSSACDQVKYPSQAGGLFASWNEIERNRICRFKSILKDIKTTNFKLSKIMCLGFLFTYIIKTGLGKPNLFPHYVI